MLLILIPGLILVALMIYASTRIKRNAAAAFEPETIETDEFIIHKSDGFLNIVDGDPKYALEMYSKDFGAGDANKTRQGRLFLTFTDDTSVEVLIADVTKENANILDDITEMIGTKRYRVIEAK